MISFLFVLITTLLLRPISAQNIYKFMRFQFGKTDFDHFTKNELLKPQNSLTLDRDYNDYIRVFEKHRKLISSSGFFNQVNYTYIKPKNSWQYGFTVNMGNAKNEFNNQKSTASLTGINNYTSRHWALSIAVSDGIALWGAGVKFQSIENNIPIQINSFPVSRNQVMNQYFLDYLEPSFGTNIIFKENIKLLQPILFSSVPLNKSTLLALSFSQSRHALFQQLRYSNNSNILQLTGSRKINFDGTIISNSTDITSTNNKWHITPRLVIHNSSLNLDVKNIFPVDNTLDLPDLGWLTGTRRGFNIGYTFTNGILDHQINFGFMTVSAAANISTPVLGREILPIAHGVQADLAGKAKTQHLSLSKIWQYANVFITGNLGYSHAYYDHTIKGDAIIEFGLTSVPVDAPLQYHLYLGELAVQTVYKLNQYSIGYRFRQYLPYLKRIDDSPINFKPEVKEPDYKTRGGGQHRFTIVYNFNSIF